MPLRALPTEQDAAAALLRAERLRGRAADRQRLAGVVAVLAVAAVVALVLPGPAVGGQCSVWRPGVDSLFGRRAGLVLPAVVLVLVVAARAIPSANPWAARLRRWTAVLCVGYALVVPLALSQQGDRPDDCGWTGTSWATLVIGVALAAAAVGWARTPPAETRIVGWAAGGDHDTELNQLELRAVFGALIDSVAQPGRPRPWRWLELAIGTAAAGLVLSLLGPWRELAVPQRLLGDLPLAFPGTTAWSLPGAGPLAWLVMSGAAATVAVLIVPRIRSVAGLIGAGTGAVAVAGWLSVVPQLPPTVAGGAGYRIAPAGWLALASATILFGCGLLAVVVRMVPAVRMVRVVRADTSGRLVAAGSAALVTVAGSLTAVLATDTPSYGVPRPANGVETLFDVRGDVLTDGAGLRVDVAGAFDHLAGRTGLSYAGTLDGSPGHWFLGNLPQYRRTEVIDTATIFAWRDGVATPLTTVRYSQIQLLGVVGDRMLAHAESRPVSRGPEPWAVVSIPLSAPYADVSLTSGSSGGVPWVSADVTVLMHGLADEVEVSPAGGGAIAVTATRRDTRSGDSWLVPAEVVRAGAPWNADSLRAPTEAGAGMVRVAADGTVAWVRGGRVMTVEPGGRPRALTAATANCRHLPVNSPSDLAYDSQGNLWIASRDGLGVITTDGVRRAAPQPAGNISDIEPGPDGLLLVTSVDGTRSSGTKRVLRLADATRSAASYPPSAFQQATRRAGDPPARCDRETAPPTTTSFTATSLGTLPVVDPPPQARDPRYALSRDAELVASAGGVRWMRPAGAAAAPDGQGGLWWTGLPPRTDDYLYAGTAYGVHVRADGSVTTAGIAVDLKRENGVGRSAAYGDRYAYVSMSIVGKAPSAYGYLDFTGRTVRQAPLTGEVGWATLPSRSMAWAATGSTPELVVPMGTALARINPDGSSATLIGGWPDDEQLPISDAIARGAGKDLYSIKAQWFTGPDRALWGYDGWYLYRLDPAGRVTVLGGQDQGVPPAANRVTVIGPALYFEVGVDVVRVTPKGAAQ